MAKAVKTRLWLGRLTFAVIFVALVMVAILPLNTLPPSWAGPDLMLALTLVWVVRRPDLVPLTLIAALFFLTDLLLQRPPGLMTGLVVLVSEALRRRNASLRALPFLLEWLAASAAIIAVTLAYRLILAMLLTPQAPLGLSLMQMVMTLLAWPVAALLSRLIFGITRPAPGEVNALGKPI